MKIAGDPGMLQGLLHSVAHACFRATKLLKQATRPFVELATKLEVFKLLSLLLINIVVIAFCPERVFASY